MSLLHSKDHPLKMLIHYLLLVKFLDVKFLNIIDEGRSSYTKKTILDKNIFINDIQPFSHSFSDSGIFGIKIGGSSTHVTQF